MSHRLRFTTPSMARNRVKYIMKVFNVRKQHDLQSKFFDDTVQKAKKFVIVFCENSQSANLVLDTTLADIFIVNQVTVCVSKCFMAKPLPFLIKNIVPLYLPTIDLLLIGVYLKNFCSDDYALERLQYEKLTCLLKQNTRANICIGGDFNASHPDWCLSKSFSYTRDRSGRLCSTFIKGNDLRVVNSKTFATSKHSDACIDLILVSHRISYDWCIREDYPHADHFAVAAYLQVPGHNVIHRQLIIRHWTLPSFDLSQETKTCWSINDKIILACKAILNFPLTNGHYCTVKPRVRLLRLKSTSKLGIRNLLLKATTSEQAWKLINRYILPKQPDIDFGINTIRDSRNQLLANFRPQRPSFIDFPANIRGQLSVQEIHQLNSHSGWSSGFDSDHFSKRIWLKFFSIHKNLVISTINCIFRFSHIPQIFTTLGCSFVLKKDGLTCRMVKSCCQPMKLIDGILKNRIKCKLDSMVTSGRQFAYTDRAGRYELIEELLSHLHLHRDIVVIKLDVEKAFDTINTTSALQSIKTFCCASTHALVCSFIQNRWLVYRLGRQYLYREETSGVPAGSSVGPLIFIVGIDPVLSALKDEGIYVLSYADDLILVTTRFKHNYDLYRIECHLNQLNLYLNHDKSESFDLSRILKGDLNFLGMDLLGMAGMKWFKAKQSKKLRDWYSSDKGIRAINLMCDVKYLPLRIKKLISMTVLSRMPLNIVPILLSSESSHDLLDRFNFLTRMVYRAIKGLVHSANGSGSPLQYLLLGYQNPCIPIIKTYVLNQLIRRNQLVWPISSQMFDELFSKKSYDTRIAHWRFIQIGPRVLNFQFYRNGQFSHALDIHLYSHHDSHVISVHNCQCIAIHLILYHQLFSDCRNWMQSIEMHHSKSLKSMYIRSLISIMVPKGYENWVWLPYSGEPLYAAPSVNTYRLPIPVTLLSLYHEAKVITNSIDILSWNLEPHYWNQLYSIPKALNQNRLWKVIITTPSCALLSKVKECTHRRNTPMHMLFECVDLSWPEGIHLPSSKVDSMSILQFKSFIQRLQYLKSLSDSNTPQIQPKSRKIRNDSSSI